MLWFSIVDEYPRYARCCLVPPFLWKLGASVCVFTSLAAQTHWLGLYFTEVSGYTLAWHVLFGFHSPRAFTLRTLHIRFKNTLQRDSFAYHHCHHRQHHRKHHGRGQALQHALPARLHRLRFRPAWLRLRRLHLSRMFNCVPGFPLSLLGRRTWSRILSRPGMRVLQQQGKFASLLKQLVH